MNALEMLNADADADWLIFAAALLLLAILVCAVVIWLKVLRRSGQKSHCKHRKHHHRPTNPTLAETSGLPPLRPPGQPPRGV
jgi:hypothetical protein